MLVYKGKSAVKTQAQRIKEELTTSKPKSETKDQFKSIPKKRLKELREGGNIIQESSPKLKTKEEGGEAFEPAFNRKGEITDFDSAEKRFEADLGKQDNITEADIQDLNAGLGAENVIKKLSGNFAGKLGFFKSKFNRFDALESGDYQQLARLALTETVNSGLNFQNRRDLLNAVKDRFGRVLRDALEISDKLPFLEELESLM